MSRHVPHWTIAAFLAAMSALACESGGSGSSTKDPEPKSAPKEVDPPKVEVPPPGNLPANEREAALVIDGERALYAALDAGDRTELTVATLHLACAETREVLEKSAADQSIALGPLRLVRLDAPPRACRPVSEGATLLAPLYRVIEPASRWRALGAEVADASLVDQLAGDAPLRAAAVPRLVLFGEVARGVALPLLEDN